jgi:hypothetical protein
MLQIAPTTSGGNGGSGTNLTSIFGPGLPSPVTYAGGGGGGANMCIFYRVEPLVQVELVVAGARKYCWNM